MFLLTNDQRTCLGLPLIKAGWEWVRLKDSPYEEKGVENWACFDDTVIRSQCFHAGCPAHTDIASVVITWFRVTAGAIRAVSDGVVATGNTSNRIRCVPSSALA